MTPGRAASLASKPVRGRIAWRFIARLPLLVMAVASIACDATGGGASGTRDAEADAQSGESHGGPSWEPGPVPEAGPSTEAEFSPESGSPPEAGPSPEVAPSRSDSTGYLEEARFAGADFGRGELLSYACIVCHTLGPGEEHLVGPNLHGVFGRPAAAAPDFGYSDALRRSGIVWTPAELDAWLARPDDFVPGNLMVFAGIYSASDRTDLLAYLLRETGAESSAAAQ